MGPEEHKAHAEPAKPTGFRYSDGSILMINGQAKKTAPLAGIPIGAFVKEDAPRVGAFFASANTRNS